MKKLLPVALIAALALSCKKNDNKNVSYQVSETKSRVLWTGRAPTHFHEGSFKVNGGISVNESGVIQNGDFTIPIVSIENFDITVDSTRTQLLEHLKSPAFFNMAVHPNAEFQILKVEAYNGTDTGAISGANYKVSGSFKMLGKSNIISFPAKITTKGDSLITEAKLQIDRHKWGMSGFNDPTQLFILPNIELKLNIRSVKK